MCNLTLQTGDILHMISSISEKKAKIGGNLRLEALLKSTHRWLDHELKEKQQNRKRKLMEMRTLSKKTKYDSIPMEEGNDDDLLAIEMAVLNVLSTLRSN